MKKIKMKHVVKKGKVARHIKYMALLSRLWRILGGGVFAALGVLGMHYLGMWAQHMKADMALDGRVVAASCVIALGTATAAFWILFRALTFWQDSQALRVASALIMGVAVCGTHYTGMAAATYTHSSADYDASHSTRYTTSGSKTSVVASHAAILICYWLTSLAVTVSVKNVERARTTQHETSAYQPNPTINTAPGGGSHAMSTATTRVTQPPSTSGGTGNSRNKVYVTINKEGSSHTDGPVGDERV